MTMTAPNFATGASSVAFGPNISYTLTVAPTPRTFSAMAFGNGIYVATNATTQTWHSTNGRVWTKSGTVSTHNNDQVCFGAGKFIRISSTFLGNTIETSTDGLVWTSSAALPVVDKWKSVAFVNNKFVFIGMANQASSDDGVTWQSSPLTTPLVNPLPVVWGNNEFVTVDHSTVVSNKSIVGTIIP
jgi:hypothetical protein